MGKIGKSANRADCQDELLAAALEHYEAILMMYELFEEKRPVMLFDVQEQRVYAYPYKEFRADLNDRSQRILKEQYEQAQVDGQIVVFVKDNVKRKFRSFSLDHDQAE